MKLLADIGGTNARFALQSGAGFADIGVLACADYPTLGEAMRAYLGQAAGRGLAVKRVRHAALAMSLPQLAAEGRMRIGGGAELRNRPIGLIGPGTGLGVSGVIPTGKRWIALAGEGGHVSFAPSTKEEVAILEALWGEYGHVSAERLLSGMGLELIHWALTGKRIAVPRITAAALEGSVAGNVALTLGATGGMYIGGGIVPRLGRLFTESAFRARFEDKGRLSPYLARIPTYLITEQYPALRGVSAMLSDHLATLQ